MTRYYCAPINPDNVYHTDPDCRGFQTGCEEVPASVTETHRLCRYCEGEDIPHSLPRRIIDQIEQINAAEQATK